MEDGLNLWKYIIHGIPHVAITVSRVSGSMEESVRGGRNHFPSFLYYLSPATLGYGLGSRLECDGWFWNSHGFPDDSLIGFPNKN